MFREPLMAYEESVAVRVRQRLQSRDDVIEKKMFGGLAFMVSGHMACGINGEELMVRIGPDGYAEALAQSHAREMDFTGRALKGFVYVAPEGFADDRLLGGWLQRALAFVDSLPPK